MRDVLLVIVAGAALAYGAYLEFRSDPWWATVLGVTFFVGVAIWERRKGRHWS